MPLRLRVLNASGRALSFFPIFLAPSLPSCILAAFELAASLPLSASGTSV